MNLNPKDLIDEIKTSHKTLFILCGLPYSGKTYLSKAILAATGCVYVSIDIILERLGYDWEADRLPDAAGWEKVFQISYEEAKQALNTGKNVLYDSTNHTKASRDVLREVAKSVGAETYVILVDASPQLIRERWEENKKTKERFVLSEELLEQTIEAFEKPADEENVLTV